MTPRDLLSTTEVDSRGAGNICRRSAARFLSDSCPSAHALGYMLSPLRGLLSSRVFRFAQDDKGQRRREYNH
jgi:hypothetical protein